MRRAVRRLPRWSAGVLRCVALAVVAGAAVAAQPPVPTAPPSKDEVQRHLARQASIATPERAEFAFDPSFYERWLFLAGEVHGIASGQAIDLGLLRHLHAKAGVRHYIGEFDAAQAAALNRYLEDGDRRGMDRVFAQWARAGRQWANEDFRRKLVALRTWNQSMPAWQRVRLHGVDDLQDTEESCLYLRELLLPHAVRHWPMAEALRSELQERDACRRIGAPAAWVDRLARVAATAPSKQNLLPFGPSAAQGKLREALRSLAEGGSALDRDLRIAHNIERLFSRPDMTGARAYGLWGLFHVVQAPVSGADPMAWLLTRPGRPLSGRVGSILLLNVRSQMLQAEPDAQGRMVFQPVPYDMDDDDIAKLEGIDALKAARRAPVTLFRLDAPGTPLPRSRLLARIGGLHGRLQPFVVDTAKAAPRPFADYALLVDGSPATEPLEAR